MVITPRNTARGHSRSPHDEFVCGLSPQTKTSGCSLETTETTGVHPVGSLTVRMNVGETRSKLFVSHAGTATIGTIASPRTTNDPHSSVKDPLRIGVGGLFTFGYLRVTEGTLLYPYPHLRCPSTLLGTPHRASALWSSPPLLRLRSPPQGNSSPR